MILLANSLSKGYSGIQLTTLELLIEIINNQLIPVTYKYGSLGASGDLATLAHVALCLIGEGEFLVDNEKISAKEILKKYSLSSVNLKAKEGLALINGTHFMTSFALHILKRGKILLLHSMITAALTIEAMQGTNTPFHPLISSVRQHHGHKIVANIIWELLDGSKIITSHKDPAVDHKVQDPYAMRCIPQVIGAIWEAFAYLEGVVATEVNSVTDNPLIFVEDKLVMSGGNFHGEPLAIPLDTVSMAIIELANITEARISRLNNPWDDQLHAFLAGDPGIESGYMIAHYTVASLINRIRTLGHPACIDNIPVSGGQEDHVSMGMNSATKAYEILEIAEEIVANELIMAVRALNMQERNKSSEILETVIKLVNKNIPFELSDHVVHNTVQQSLSLIRSGKIIKVVEKFIPNSIPKQFRA